MTTAPRRASLRRWLRHSRRDYSIYRSLEYERVDALVLPGRTLDLGGGALANYVPLLDIRGQLLSVNIVPQTRPSVLADLNRPLPFRDGCFDDVITFNTLEHVFNDEIAIREMLRVLKPGGRFHVGVPFLYRVHGSPDDYHRHTASWWKRRLLSLDVEPASLTIEPLVWDPFASAFSLVEFTRFRALLKKPVMLLGLVADGPAWRRGRKARTLAERNADFALGYFIAGRRRGADAVDVPTTTSGTASPRPTRRSVSMNAVKSVGRRIVEGVPLAERPATFVVRSILQQRHLLSNRSSSMFRHEGVRFLARPADWNGVREVLLDGEYDVIEELLTAPAPTVIDLGANIGMFSIRVFGRHPAAVIHSYEPDPDTFEMLRQNRALNPGLDWTCHQAAVWSETGTVSFEPAPTSTASRMGAGPMSTSVPSVNLAEAMSRSGTATVDLLKIDIEGAEEAVLTSGAELLGRVHNLIIEIHPDRVDEARVVDILRSSFASLHVVPGRSSSKPLVVATQGRSSLPRYR